MVLPYKDKQNSKKEQVADMFDAISPKYDFLNRLLSLGIDIHWRKKLIAKIKKVYPSGMTTILDVATGTADLAIAARKLRAKKIVGIDISEGMIEVGRKKISKKKLDKQIELRVEDAAVLSLEDESVDVIMVAFGVRNFEDLKKGILDMKRVLKKDGMLVILEFSKPNNALFSWIYRFYFIHILPRIGSWISKDRSAYTYLPESVDAFPFGDEFIAILEELGFKRVSCSPLTFGVSSIYEAFK